MLDLHHVLNLPFAGEMGPLLILSVILLAGVLGGWLARRLHVPTVTGNMLAGIFLGPACLDLFAGLDVATELKPLSTFAMGVVTVSVGSHLSYRRIHNALRRIITIAAFEVLGAVVLVTLVARLLGADWPLAFVLGSIAASTAPDSNMALVREMRAKGTFVKTFLSVVALDNMLCMMLFAFSTMLLVGAYRTGPEAGGASWALVHMVWQFGGSFCLAMVLGVLVKRLMHRPKTHDFSLVFVAILLSVGISQYFELSPLLTSLFFGVYLGNSSEEIARQTRSLEPIEPLLFVCFFTVAGASLHLDTLAEAGLLCAAYLLARFVGKGAGACIGGWLSHASRRIWTNVPLSLVPQAGVAIGLVVLLRGNPDIPEGTWGLIDSVVLGAVTVNELIGPLFTRLALRRSNEVNKDRRRLIEFLQEEFIMTGLEAKDKWDALRKLTRFYVRSHRVHRHLEDGLYATIEEREKDFSTAVGRAAAIPHGRIDEGTGIRGVLGICREGISFDAPDGEPVRIIMLVVTPKGYEREHLEVMASLAQMISDDAIRTRLLAAISPNDAWEIIESKDTRNYNYFLEKDEDID